MNKKEAIGIIINVLKKNKNLRRAELVNSFFDPSHSRTAYRAIEELEAEGLIHVKNDGVVELVSQNAANIAASIELENDVSKEDEFLIIQHCLVSPQSFFMYNKIFKDTNPFVNPVAKKVWRAFADYPEYIANNTPYFQILKGVSLTQQEEELVEKLYMTGSEYVNAKKSAIEIFNNYRKRMTVESLMNILRNAKEIEVDDLKNSLKLIADQIDSFEDVTYNKEDLEESIIKEIEALQNGTDGSIRTGFSMFDYTFDLFKPGRYTIIAARPSIGKTAFANNLFLNMSRNHRSKLFLFFSLEMTSKEIILRLASIDSEVSEYEVKNMTNTKTAINKFKDAARKIVRTENIVIDDKSNLTPFILRKKIEKYKRDTGINDLGAIFIDYFQLMGGGRMSRGRYETFTEYSNELKEICKDYNVPIILLSQLRRPDNSNKKHVPKLQDLKETGSLEQDADAVILLDRDTLAEGDKSKIMNVIIAKNRHGSVGQRELVYFGKYYKVLEKK